MITRTLATWFTAALALAGCRATLVPPDGADPERVQLQKQSEQLAQLQAKNQELSSQMEALRARLASEGATVPSAAALEATPALAGLSLGSAGAIECADAGCVARVYLEPRDGRGRFVQIVGSVAVAVALVDPDGRTQTLGQRTFDPLELRDAYRAGFMGTHYTLEVPVGIPAGVAAGTALAVTAEFTDAWTGRAWRTGGGLRVPERAAPPTAK